MFEYRVIRNNTSDKLTFTIKTVEFDENNNPVNILDDSGHIEAGNSQELMVLLIEFMSSLTKPIIDRSLFKADNQPAYKKAMEIFKNV